VLKIQDFIKTSLVPYLPGGNPIVISLQEVLGPLPDEEMWEV